ncbi:hypothetical protein [Synechococcus sp. MIT S1220]|uniref:hypothetical protein n=1 Tax=Synechococcus sp. MIT S1220 TaxID=3082549 RepID=UPI0039AEA116
MLILLMGSGLSLGLIGVDPLQASQAWKQAVPYPEASSGASAAATAVLNRGGSEECLRGKLSNAIVRLSNSCDAADRFTPVCALATDLAGQESELSFAEMVSTSEILLKMLKHEASR